jgi:hypothetical protein
MFFQDVINIRYIYHHLLIQHPRLYFLPLPFRFFKSLYLSRLTNKLRVYPLAVELQIHTRTLIELSLQN